jgi:hypothetical protein
LTPSISGPSVRAGFIDAPLIGLSNKPSSATAAPSVLTRIHSGRERSVSFSPG